MTSVAFVTIIAGNYAAYASALMASVAAHESAADRFVLVVDSTVTEIPGASVISPNDLGLGDSEIQRLTSIYDVMEYCTSLKASTLLHLLSSYEEVVFLDPDVVLFASLTSRPMWQVDWTVALTPHRLTPPPKDGLVPDEELIQRYGVWNLGFMAVRRGGEPVLEWWHERLKWWSLKSPSSSVYTDQRWMDLAPSYFDIFVMRDPTMNVAPWNIDERDLQEVNARWCVGTQPLTFAHFSGIRATVDQDVLGPYARVNDDPGRAQQFLKLCNWYRQEVSDQSSFANSEYAFARDRTGRRITPASRRRWRRDLYLGRMSKQNSRQRLFHLSPSLTESHTAEGLRSGFRSDLKRIRASPKAETLRRKLHRVPVVRRLLSLPRQWNAL